MGTSAPLPNELTHKLWDVVTTLTPEAQTTALHKAEESGFDLNRGRIPLAETLINLDQARAVLVGVIDGNKLAQLPLKVQYSLYGQALRVSQNLQSLTAGTDSIQALDDSVEDLTSSIWQYNLQNLSGEVLGFTEKMNQLKQQETLIRQVHRKARAFTTLQENAESILTRLGEIDKLAQNTSTVLQEASSRADELLAGVATSAECAAAALSEAEKHRDDASSDAEKSSVAVGKATEFLEQLRAAKESAVASANSLEETLEAASAQNAELGEKAENLLKQLSEKCDAAIINLETGAKSSSEQLSETITEILDSIKSDLNAAIAAFEKSTEEQQQSIDDLVENTNSRLIQAEKAQKISTDGSLDEFKALRETKLKEIDREFRRIATDVETESKASVEKNDGELKRLTAELEILESQIRDSISRATGFTLFHAFQKRQEDLAKAKRFWELALATTVLVSLIASGFFIWSLQFVHEYNAAFFLKLSISLPIIYAIAFCNLQYSRERSLEEEYAFKSSISISLDPYQKLVRSSINESDSAELSKYSAFLIESVNRVFTPPTAHSDSHSSEQSGDMIAKVLQSLTKFVEPFLTVLKK